MANLQQNVWHYTSLETANRFHIIQQLRRPCGRNHGKHALGTVETIRGDRAFLADLMGQVRAGIARGESVEQIQQKIDLSRHHPWVDNLNSVRSNVRAVYPVLSKQR